MKSPPRPPLPAELEGLPTANRLGKFACIRKLGSGGMGEVWQAWDTELRRWVALKLVRGNDAELLARFRREALLAAQFVHPHAAAIYEFGESRGRPYIAMQLVDGRTLKQSPPADPKEWVPLLADAARAVHAAHDRGIIHRDLKPDNLMVDGNHVYVMDFGLARPVVSDSELSSAGQIVGTPAYMAPEQAQAGDLGPAADIWGLGATMYELLTSRPPFKGSTAFETLQLVLSQDPAPLPGADPDLATIAMKCLQKDACNRYGSALELAEDLQHWLRHEPIRARPPSWTYRLRKWTRKHRTLSVAGAAALLFVAGIGTLMWHHSRQNRDLVIAQLRETAETSLAAALELRRSDNPAGMEKFGRRLEDACARASAMLPEDPEPWFLLGRLYRARMEESKASRSVEEALRRNPGHAPARYERVVRTANRLRLRSLELQNQLGGGPATLATILAQDPEGSELQDVLREDLSVVLSDLNSLRASEVRCAQGLAEWARGQPDSAIPLLAEALALNPDLVEAVEALASIHTHAKRWEEALRILDRAIARDPGYRVFYQARANLRLYWIEIEPPVDSASTELLGRGLGDAEELLRRAPDQVTGYVIRSRLHAASAAWKSARGLDPTAEETAALADMDLILQMAPEALETRRRRAGICVDQARRQFRAGLSPETALRRAMRDLVESLARQPRNARALTDLATAKAAMGAWKAEQGQDPFPELGDAVREYTEAIEANPNLATAWHMRGAARLQWWNVLRGDRPQEASELLKLALADLHKAVALGPRNGHALADRAVIRAQAAALKEHPPESEFEAAVRDLDDAQRAAPDDVEPALQRSLVLLIWSRTAEDPGSKCLEALKWMDWVRQRIPGRYDLLSRRARVMMDLAFIQRKAGQDWSTSLQQGIADAETCLSHLPNHLEAHMALSALLRNRATLEKTDTRANLDLLKRAVETASRATRISPGQVQAWLELGSSWEELGIQTQSLNEDGRPALRDAKSAFLEAVRLSPKGPTPRIRLARVHMLLAILAGERGENPTVPYAEALKEIDQVLATEPGRPDAMEVSAIARTRYAHWCWIQNKPDEALTRAAAEAAERFRGPSTGFMTPIQLRLESSLLLVSILERSGRPEEQPYRRAIAAIEEAIVQDPKGRAGLAERLDQCRRGLEKLGRKP